MGLTETLLFYLLIGGGVAIATAARADGLSPLANAYQAFTALFFWPLYVPLLLAPRAEPAPTVETAPAAHDDELAARIRQVELELDSALAGLDGWSEEALSREPARIIELRHAWNLQAERIREMDRLLSGVQETESSGKTTAPAQRIGPSEQARLENFARLRAIRQQAYEDLTSTLARVRELVSLIHLAKFTGEPVSRSEDLVAQIAAAVEGLSEVAGWREPPVDQVQHLTSQLSP